MAARFRRPGQKRRASEPDRCRDSERQIDDLLCACVGCLSCRAYDRGSRYCRALSGNADRHCDETELCPVCNGRALSRRAVLIEHGEFEAGTALMVTTLDARTNSGWFGRFTEHLGILAQGVAGLGQIGKALATVDQALARAERWYVAELLRIKGELLVQEATARSASAAENCFVGAIDVAREQGALFWELRGALSLARLRAAQDQRDEARQVLAPVYDRFTEGFATADLRATKAMLDALPSPGVLSRDNPW